MKHPISYEEAKAFAAEYFDAPADVFLAALKARGEFWDKPRGPEGTRRAETARRLTAAVNQLVDRIGDVIAGSANSVGGAIAYLDPDREGTS